jgi:hypothetical protein
MDPLLQQVLIEAYTTHQRQVVFSALDPQAIFDARAQVENAHIQYGRTSYNATVHTPLFPDLVRGLCHHLWDGLTKYGSGNAFSLFEEDDLENRSENPVVQQVIECLVPQSRQYHGHISLLIDAYCTDGCTPSERRELGLSRALARQDQLDLLITLLQEVRAPRHFLSMHEDHHTRLLPRLIVHIEEIENITHCALLDVVQFTSALIYLAEGLADGFTLWLNAEDDDPDLPKEVKHALGSRFISRITHDLTA